jgi:hypothetical protein
MRDVAKEIILEFQSENICNRGTGFIQGMNDL